MYSLCGNIKFDYYLKTRVMRVWLISCIPDSNRNSTREFVRVSSNWFADELRYRVLLLVLSLTLLFSLLAYILTSLFIDFFFFLVEGRRFKPDLRVVHVRDLNFVLRSEIFVQTDKQL